MRSSRLMVFREIAADVVPVVEPVAGVVVVLPEAAELHKVDQFALLVAPAVQGLLHDRPVLVLLLIVG